MKPASELLVLAGGFGRRLRPSVPELPKPLAPVAGKPYIHYLIEMWLQQGVSKLTFLLFYQAELIEAYLREQSREGLLANCDLNVLTEPRPMGTGGAIAYAVSKLGLTDSFLVSNADTWLETGIRQLAEMSAPAIGIVKVANSKRYGSVRTDERKVIAFEEKRHSSGFGWINSGLYHLNAGLFQDWNGEPFSLEATLFPKLALDGRLNAVPLVTEFIDIGVPEEYFRFERWVAAGKTGCL